MSDGKSEALEAMRNPPPLPFAEREGTPEFYLAIAASRMAAYRETGNHDQLEDAKSWARCVIHHIDRIKLGLDQ